MSDNIRNFLMSFKNGNVSSNDKKSTEDLFIVFVLFFLMLDYILYLSSNFVILIVSILLTITTIIALFIFSSKSERKCIKDTFIFVNLDIVFLTLVLTEIKATFVFCFFIGLGCTSVAIIQFFLIQKKIRENFFEKKKGKISPVMMAVTTCCSVIGCILGRILSVTLSQETMTYVLLFFVIAISPLFTAIVVSNLIALYYCHKYEEDLRIIEDNPKS